MKKLFLTIFILLAATSVWADTTTSRFGLTKPDVGSTNWGPKLNTNADTIDNAAGLSLTNTFSGTENFNAVTNFGAGSVVTFSTAPTFSTGFVSNGDVTISESGNANFVLNAGASNPPIILIEQGGVVRSRLAVSNSPGSLAAGSVAGDLIIRAENHQILFTPDGGTTTDIIISSITNGVSNRGTNTNDSASAGFIGETASASVLRSAAITMANNVVQSISTMTLTAGQYDIGFCCGYLIGVNAGTGMTCALSQTANTIPAANTSFFQNSSGELQLRQGFTTSANDDYGMCSMTYPVKLSGSTTFYLISQIAFAGGTTKSYGGINAIRRR